MGSQLPKTQYGPDQTSVGEGTPVYPSTSIVLEARSHTHYGSSEPWKGRAVSWKTPVDMHVLMLSPQQHALKTQTSGLFLTPGEEVTSLFESVFIIGLSISRGGEKTMLKRSGGQGPRGLVMCSSVLWPKVYILYACPATLMIAGALAGLGRRGGHRTVNVSFSRPALPVKENKTLSQ